MRIISGLHRGRKINPPKNLPVRPTTDLAKESLFNILNNHFDLSQVRVLDLFAGTGSISFEFASRESPDIIAVDINHRCIKFIDETIQKLELKSISTIKGNVLHVINHLNKKFDIIFADPPYNFPETGSIPGKIFELELLNDEAWLIIEHDKNIDFSDHLNFLEQRKYSKVNFSIFKN